MSQKKLYAVTVMLMKSILDVRALLKRFGIFIYTKSRLGDLELMEFELQELFKARLITNEEFVKAKQIIYAEKQKID